MLNIEVNRSAEGVERYFDRELAVSDYHGLSDPHWHVHCFVHNATFDPIEKRWKAGQLRGLIADKSSLKEVERYVKSDRFTVDQVVVLPDGADAKGWYVSLSRARDAMHVYTRNKAALRQSVMQAGERKSVWELVQALQRSKPQSRDRKMPDLWAARRAEISRDVEIER